MADDLTLKIGGAEFFLAPLPWRVVKKLQPQLYALYTKINSDGNGDKPLGALSEGDLESLANVVFTALHHLEEGKAPTREKFEDMPITVAELVRAIPVVARAAGMISRKLTDAQEAGEGSGK